MRITESQLRRIIRQEVRGLREGLSARERGQVLRSFAYGQLMQHAPGELERLETQAPEAYEQFLSDLYDMADPASGEGLDGKGFLPHLRAAMKSAGLGGGGAAPRAASRPRASKPTAASIARKMGAGGNRFQVARQVEKELYDTVAKPHDEHIIANDVQGTSRMRVGDLASPGEKEVLKIIAKLPDPAHQAALLSAMARRTGEDSDELRGLMDYLASGGD